MNEYMWLSTKLFFNSPFFVAIVTLFVGLFAIYLYLKQRMDRKREAASLILQEIRYAETRMKEARAYDHKYPFFDRLLPTSSWHNNIHLFIKDFEQNEIDTISHFYASVSYLDNVITKISDHHNALMRPLVITPSPLTEILNAEMILQDISRKTELIYNTVAVDRLRRIAVKRMWWEIL